MSLFQVPRVEPLAAYSPELAGRFQTLLMSTLLDELGLDRTAAQALADELVWTVSREPDGLCLNMAYRDAWTIGGGGQRHLDADGLELYVRQAAYTLAGRQNEFVP